MACPGTWLCNWRTGSDWRLTWHREAIEVKTDRIGGLRQTAPLVICVGARAAPPPHVASDAVTANSIALSQTPQNQFLLLFLTLQNPRPAAFTPAFVFYSGSQNLSFYFFCNSIWKLILSYKVKTKICISDISTNSRSLLKQTCDIGHGIGKPCIRTFCNSFFFHLMFLFLLLQHYLLFVMIVFTVYTYTLTGHFIRYTCSIAW